MTPDATSAHGANLGAVFTKPWVVDLMLDLSGYVSSEPLFSKQITEPSCGDGAFIGPIVVRLVESCRDGGVDISECKSAIRATDVNPESVVATRALVRKILKEAGVSPRTATKLASSWVAQADFLLDPPAEKSTDWVVGNPPYVRTEDIPAELMAKYRHAMGTMRGRADIYVGFIEAGLRALRPDGTLTFICADRWMRNQYGAALRGLVDSHFSLDLALAAHDVDAFESKVNAYPAIIQLRNRTQGPLLVADGNSAFGEKDARKFIREFRKGPSEGSHLLETNSFSAYWRCNHHLGADGWPAGSPESLALLERLEDHFAPIEATGVQVRTGIATGADAIFVVPEGSDIEEDRLVPAITAKDIQGGAIDWSGRYLANPWDDGGLVDLGDYPGLKKYLQGNRKALLRRHVSQKSPETWWRTIDRVDPATAGTPKLLLPDIKDRIRPVLDRGEFQPMHSLYYVLSDRWDLEVLGGLLMSDLANLFLEAYSVRMASGYLRVSAQYLRKIRAPQPEDVPAAAKRGLARAFKAGDTEGATRYAMRAYDL